MTLTDFLLARIAEDEEEAQSLLNRDSGPAEQGGYSWCFDRDYGPTGVLDIAPVRVLAECEAHRRVVALLNDADENGFDTAMDACLAIATIYADHPDYLDKWRA